MIFSFYRSTNHSSLFGINDWTTSSWNDSKQVNDQLNLEGTSHTVMTSSSCNGLKSQAKLRHPGRTVTRLWHHAVDPGNRHINNNTHLFMLLTGARGNMETSWFQSAHESSRNLTWASQLHMWNKVLITSSISTFLLLIWNIPHCNNEHAD